jgi:hypothetical protein
LSWSGRGTARLSLREAGCRHGVVMAVGQPERLILGPLVEQFPVGPPKSRLKLNFVYNKRISCFPNFVLSKDDFIYNTYIISNF